MIEALSHAARRRACTVDRKGVGGSSWKLDERARARGDLGSAVRLTKEAVDVFASARGGSSAYRDAPIQRIARDVRAVNLHELIHPNTNAELYGRVLCGMEANTLYI